MLKLFTFTLILSFSAPGHSSAFDQIFTMKDRIRLSLWHDGIEHVKKPKTTRPHSVSLPEELERALQKL
jgi:hypothetical protein